MGEFCLRKQIFEMRVRFRALHSGNLYAGEKERRKHDRSWTIKWYPFHRRGLHSWSSTPSTHCSTERHLNDDESALPGVRTAMQRTSPVSIWLGRDSRIRWILIMKKSAIMKETTIQFREDHHQLRAPKALIRCSRRFRFIDTSRYSSPCRRARTLRPEILL